MVTEDEKVETSQQQEQSPQETPEPVDEKKVRSALAGDDIEVEQTTAPADFRPSEDPPADEPAETKDPSQETPEETPTPTPTPETPETTEAPETATPTDFTPGPIWNKVKSDWEKQFGEGTFKYPEGITPDNEHEVFYEFMAKNIEPDLSELPEEAREIIQLHKEGKYDPEKYFEQRTSNSDILKLPDDDFLFHALKLENGKSEKNPDGWDDNDIKEFINKKTKIERYELAKQRRGQFSAMRQQKAQEQQKALQVKQQQELQRVETQRKETASKIVNQFKNDSDFFGIQFTPEDKQAFDRDFFEMVKINPETGSHKILEMLSDDKTLYKVAAILWKGEGLKGYLSKMKEEVKENIEKKLNPRLEETPGSSKTPKVVDRGRLV